MSQIVVNDVALHYQRAGEGENLVLIHGLGANMAFWYPGIASWLSPHYRTIVYDLRGHGKSAMPPTGYSLTDMVQDLHGLLAHLGVTRTHLVGHSYGARVALVYANAYPDRVATLTIADTQIGCLQPRMRLRDWPYWETWKQKLHEQGVFPLPKEDEWISFHLLQQLNQVSPDLTVSGFKKRSKPSLKSRNMGRKGSERWQQLMSTTTAKQEFDRQEEITVESIKKLTMPTKAIYGECSHCLPTCWKLKELIADFQVFIVDKIGHFHPAIKPKLFVETLLQALGEEAND